MKLLAFITCILFHAHLVRSDEPIITSLTENGLMSWSNSYTSGHYRIEWSSHPNSGWRSDWSGMTQIPTTGGTITTSVPMFYRVVYLSPSALSGNVELMLVPGGGQPGGPAYDFYVSKYEVTCEQFVTFLNDAESNAANDRGANMFFASNGDVYFDSTTNVDEMLFDISNSYLSYNINLLPGSRYSTFTDKATHPITGISWYCALKYCNWFTIISGRGTSQRCYSEGNSTTNWKPANVTYAQWLDGFDNSERNDLVVNYAGFRLPMINYAAFASSYGEFYKAAAWTGLSNTVFGFGRSTLTAQDSNYLLTSDPFESLTPATTPVGFYNGATNMGFVTRANGNAYGIFDLCGNVSEWSTDSSQSGSLLLRAHSGGSFASEKFSTPEGLYNQWYISQETRLPSATDISMGFRIITTRSN